MRGVVGVLAALAAVVLANCAARPEAETPKLGFAAERPAPDLLRDPLPPMGHSSLAGRTIHVSSIADIRLAPKEIVLTFDDGPMPGKTSAVLDALDRHGVKATFLMVGQMALAYPELVRRVAARGHTIGSHTQNHANLRAASYQRAAAEIDLGRDSIRAALGPARHRAADFFRFPYLADTPATRSRLASDGIVVIDVDIDTKDYFQSSPDQLRQRAVDAVARRGSGIVLMHDIHGRTAGMLPGFLSDLAARGYKVVHLAPGRAAGPRLVAAAD